MAIGRSYHATLKIVSSCSPWELGWVLWSDGVGFDYGPSDEHPFGRQRIELASSLKRDVDYLGFTGAQRQSIMGMVIPELTEPGVCWVTVSGGFTDDQFIDTGRYLDGAISGVVEKIRGYPFVERVDVDSVSKRF